MLILKTEMILQWMVQHISYPTNASSKHISLTLTDTYLKCYSSISSDKQLLSPLILPLSNSCPVKDIYIKGTTFSR